MKKISSVLTKLASKLLKDVHRAQNSKQVVIFLGGLCDDDNAWRKEVMREFGDVFFIDPYDKHWEADDNIYDELAGMMVSDYVIFYRGGKGTSREKRFLQTIGEEDKYRDFKDLDNLKSYIKKVITPSKKK